MIGPFVLILYHVILPVLQYYISKESAALVTRVLYYKLCHLKFLYVVFS